MDSLKQRPPTSSPSLLEENHGPYQVDGVADDHPRRREPVQEERRIKVRRVHGRYELRSRDPRDRNTQADGETDEDLLHCIPRDALWRLGAPV